MRPTVWGPPMWHVLFACAWHCDAAHFDVLRRLLLTQMPLLLPCEKCRKHAKAHMPNVHRRARGEPRDPAHAFRWLWHLKDEVNQTLRVRSVALDEITERYVLHGGVVDDVIVGDLLVLVALAARKMQRDDLFVEFCASLAVLLPLPEDSELRRHLERDMRRPVVPAAVRAARAARVERGLRPLVAQHYVTVFGV